MRQTHYRGVIRVSSFRFLPFLRCAIWTDTAPGRGWPLPASRRPDLTRLSRPFFFDAPPGTNGRCLWPDLQFPVNKSLAVEEIYASRVVELSHATARRTDST